MSTTTTLTRYLLALFVASLLAVGCGSSSRPEANAKNECIFAGDRLLVHALIRANYATGPIKTSRDLWQFSCRVSDRSCKGISLTLDNLDRDRPITMMDLNTLEGAELVSIVGSVAIIRWGPLRTFTIDFDRGAVTYVESGENPLGASTEGRGEASCRATNAPGRAAAVEPSYERDPKPDPIPFAIPASPDPVMPASQPVSCFSTSDPSLTWPVSICAFDHEACKEAAARMGITKARCQPADSMACTRSINGLRCFGDMATCLLKTDAADRCLEVRYARTVATVVDGVSPRAEVTATDRVDRALIPEGVAWYCYSVARMSEQWNQDVCFRDRAGCDEMRAEWTSDAMPLGECRRSATAYVYTWETGYFALRTMDECKLVRDRDTSEQLSRCEAVGSVIRK